MKNYKKISGSAALVLSLLLMGQSGCPVAKFFSPQAPPPPPPPPNSVDNWIEPESAVKAGNLINYEFSHSKSGPGYEVRWTFTCDVAPSDKFTIVSPASFPSDSQPISVKPSKPNTMPDQVVCEVTDLNTNKKANITWYPTGNAYVEYAN